MLEGVGYLPDDLGVTTDVEPIPEEIEVLVDGDPVEEAEVVEAATEAVTEGLDAEPVAS